MTQNRAPRPADDNISAPAAVTVGAAVRPAFIRLPDAGTRCAYTGLSRSAVVNLCVPNKANGYRPKVRSVRLAKANAAANRGSRLIDYESLLAYLNGCDSKAA
jgi:hypothetical protein